MEPMKAGYVERQPMQAIRIIKKYPNRRLYDTELSRYVTLSDVRELVMQGMEFKVVDTANSNDITRSILLQIMLEEESGGAPLFSTKMLSQMIYFYGGTLQGMFARYLEESLDLFASQQRDIRAAMGENPLDAMTRMAQHNMQIWTDMQQNFFRTRGSSDNETAGDSRTKDDKKTTS